MRKKLFLLALAVLAAVLCAGCLSNKEPQPSPTIEIVIQPMLTPTPEPTPVPTPTPPAGERFRLLDQAILNDLVTQDAMTLHQFIDEPILYGIDASSVPLTLGNPSAEAETLMISRFQTYLDELSEIPREELSDAQQISCDMLEQYLTLAVSRGAYPYYEEPLTRYTGIQTYLPLMFGLYEVRTEQDVIDYLALLSDVPRYLSAIMEYERNRAANGLFMTDAALDSVLADCNDILDAADELFLVGTFQTALDKIEDISDEQKAAYRKQNETLLTGAFADAYQALRDGLAVLRPFCRKQEGMYALGDTGLLYFELRMQQEGSAAVSVSDAEELLETELFGLLAELETLSTDPEVRKGGGKKLTTGDVYGDLALLKDATTRMLGELPEHRLNVTDLPKELETQMSEAAYVIPSLDGWSDNEVLMNRASASSAPLLTLAHETYPGHLFQYVRLRSQTDGALALQVMSFPGYVEGWAKHAETLFLSEQDQFDKIYWTYQQKYDLATNVLLPAIISIRVNYFADGLDDVQKYLASLGISDTVYAKNCFERAVDLPFYSFSYAIGYCEMSDLVRYAEAELAGSFDIKKLLNAYLDLGFGYYDQLREHMDVWIDGQIQD